MVLVHYHSLHNFILIFKTRFHLLLNKWNTEGLHFCPGKTVFVMLRTSQCSKHGWDSQLLPNFRFLNLNFQRSHNPSNNSWEATKLVENFMIASSLMKNFKAYMDHSWIELLRTQKSFSHHLINSYKSNSNTFHKRHSWVKFSQICMRNGKQECNHLHRKRRETILHQRLSTLSLTVNFSKLRISILARKISKCVKIKSIHKQQQLLSALSQNINKILFYLR